MTHHHHASTSDATPAPQIDAPAAQNIDGPHAPPEGSPPAPPTATPRAPPPGLLHAPHPTSHVTYTSHATLLTCGFYPGTCVTIASTVATELRTAITTHFAHSKGRWEDCCAYPNYMRQTRRVLSQAYNIEVYIFFRCPIGPQVRPTILGIYVTTL